MFSLKDKFKFLDDGIDFPFYNDVPKLSTADWSIVLISVILVIITISLFSSHQALKSVMIFLITIIPALYNLSVLLVHCLFLEWLITLHILEEFFKYY